MTTNVARESRLDPRLLDRIEQVIVSVLYAFLFARLWPTHSSLDNAFSLLILISEGAVVLFILIRRPTDRISLRPADWLYAMAGTALPLLVAPGEMPLAARTGAILIAIGTFFHVGAKLSLARSFGAVAANRGVKQIGLYRIVRHPMYAGYVMTHVGFLLLQPSWWNLGIYILAWSFMILRIRAEERLLFQDPDYRAFAARVPYRLFPGVY